MQLHGSKGTGQCTEMMNFGLGQMSIQYTRTTLPLYPCGRQNSSLWLVSKVAAARHCRMGFVKLKVKGLSSEAQGCRVFD